MALGVNTAALYTKKGADSMNSTLSLLLRLFSAFPKYLPRIKAPDVKDLLERIKEIDPSFRITHLGPLLGMEKNSSSRIKNAGLDSSNPSVQSLASLINMIINENPNNWFLIKEAVELEARARGIVPAERVWREGGWSMKKPPQITQPVGNDSDPKVSKTAKPLVRRSKS